MADTSIQIEPFEIQEDIEHKKFFALLGDEECFIKYRYLDPSTIDFFSTYVPKELSGKGYAGNLAEYALRFARDQALKVVASCSYIRGYIAKHPEYENLLA